MKRLVPFAALLLSPPIPAIALTAPAPETDSTRPPGDIVETAPAEVWESIAPADLLVMDLAPDADGQARRVIIQLMPPPFSQGWVTNIRALAAAHWWDGTNIYRVQDNYVVQWGGEAEAKPAPGELSTVPQSAYEAPVTPPLQAALRKRAEAEERKLLAALDQSGGDTGVLAVGRIAPRDAYADETLNFAGWPVALDYQTDTAWPVHCYGMVGVSRDLPPDTGSGAELYAVIGHAPRHLDRNLAVVGRVVEGMEHLSILPRGTGALGVYGDDEAQRRVPIRSVRLASDLPQTQRPAFEYLSTESDVFAAYARARESWPEEFFTRPAGGADICNIPVPVRRAIPTD